MDEPFDSGHHPVKDKIPPPAITVAIDDANRSTRFEDAVHFRQHGLFVRIMMKAVNAGDDVEAAIFERKLLAVAFNEGNLVAVFFTVVPRHPEHSGAEI